MQISVVNYQELRKDPSFRVDAEHHSPRFDSLLKRIKTRKNVLLEKTLTERVRTGHTPSTKRSEFYQPGVVKFVKTDNLRQGFIRSSGIQMLSEEGSEQIRRSELRPDDVVVTIIGATEDVIARAARVYEDLGRANINQNIALIRSELPAGFLATFLNCKYGRDQLIWLSRQTEQFNLNCREVEQIRVLELSDGFVCLIHSIDNQQHDLLVHSQEIYSQAETYLLTELGLCDWEPGHCLTSEAAFSETQTAQRFDAEYFQARYEEILDKVRGYKDGWACLSDLATIKHTDFHPKAESSYKYIELSNISAFGEISGFTEAKGKELPTRARRRVKTGVLYN